MTAVERRRSPIRQSPIGDVALPGLCTVPGCQDVWLIETNRGRLCRAHHARQFARPALPLTSVLVPPGAGVSRGAEPQKRTAA